MRQGPALAHVYEDHGDMSRTLIHGAQALVGNGDFAEVSLLIDGDRIAAILPKGETVGNAKNLDARDRLIIPGRCLP